MKLLQSFYQSFTLRVALAILVGELSNNMLELVLVIVIEVI